MKAIILVDIPDEQLDGIDAPLENMYANVTLDYDEKVIYAIGEVVKEIEPKKIYELRQYVKFDLYTVGENFVLQLFEIDDDPNDIEVSCIWENDNVNVDYLLDTAIEWCKEQL